MAAKKGFTLIELLVVVSVIGVLIALLLPAIQMAREASWRLHCGGNLSQIGKALANYQDAHSVYPWGVGADDDGPVAQFSSEGNRRYSAHAMLLPFLEQELLYDQINFDVRPFFPDTSGDPQDVTGNGPNETAAQQWVDVFVCPSDLNRMPSRPWGQNNYRSCNGSSWDGRAGNGVFGQNTSTKPGEVLDGLSKTAAFSERIRGHDKANELDMQTDLFGLSAPWTEENFREWCLQLSEVQASTLVIHDVTMGQTWLEGNMSWTRYNHVMPPGRHSCKTDITWNGVAMTASSRHPGGVQVLFADGAVRFVDQSIDLTLWQAFATISGNEVVQDAAF